MRHNERWIAVGLAAAGAAAYLAFGWGADTSYDYYGRLAAALLGGHWWLTEHPPWLNELLSCGDGRWCLAYPPLPAILTIPFLPFGSTALAQSLMSRVAGGLSAGPLYLGLRAYGAPRWVAVAGVVVSTMGTTLLFSSADGRAWYAAHAVAVPLECVAFWLAARGGPSWGIGAAIGLATLARLPVAAVTPALALLAARRGGRPYLRVLSGIVLAGVPFALVYAGYNVLRWGTVLDAGYARLAQGDVFFSYGLFSLMYLPRHIYAIFLEPPDLVEGVPWFLRPRYKGMSLFLTTPPFLWVFAGLRSVGRDAAVTATALAALLAFIPNVLHGTVGFAQFGYRFSLDAQPFLVALALTGDAVVGGVWRRRPSWLFLAAVALAIAINVYATIAIIRFGYWQ
ncbi:MAG: hypothetical protein KGN00_10855 [Chloroflexota bacterium]|nr:hypothetical protein [Chloroflexota bacterium]MDE3194177.1 hypothetical protein [Chloroflexota bacterium]